MENLLMFLATSLVLRISSPKFKRYFIGSGCSSLLLAGSTTIHFKKTREGDGIYFYDATSNGITYGLITVQMKEVCTSEQAENILVQYINQARRPFGIACNLGMEIDKKNGVVTITDYWQDDKGIDWKIKAYTDGKALAILYVKNIGLATVKDHDAFLNGFRFSSFS